MSDLSLPLCIGIIPDGNRRWAKGVGVSPVEGHKKGLEVLKEVISWTREAGVRHMVAYVFSTENWNRSADEVAYLLSLFRQGIAELQPKTGEGIAIKFLGERERLDAALQKSISEIESSSPAEPLLTVWLCLSYGGRAEIVSAVNRAIEQNTPVTESSFGELLSTRGMPDPDLIIRTSGEMRLSNFLPWQSVYSELFFTDTLWPDFSKAEFQAILEAYGKRTRRKGI